MQQQKSGKHFIGRSHPSRYRLRHRQNNRTEDEMCSYGCAIVMSACQMWIIRAFRSLYYWVRGNAAIGIIMLSSNSLIFRILFPSVPSINAVPYTPVFDCLLVPLTSTLTWAHTACFHTCNRDVLETRWCCSLFGSCELIICDYSQNFLKWTQFIWI